MTFEPLVCLLSKGQGGLNTESAEMWKLTEQASEELAATQGTLACWAGDCRLRQQLPGDCQ